MTWQTSEAQNLAIARQYIGAIARGEDFSAIDQFLHPDMVQEELPNRMLPQGARHDRAALAAGAERGRTVMASQEWEIVNEVAAGEQVVLEIRWAGTLAIALGDLPAGFTMRARVAVFLEFREGKIAVQRNYDAYEP